MSATAKEYFTANAIASDMFALMCGEYLGGGCGREVYVSLLDPNFVIKIETGTGRFQNAMEWRFWEENRGAPDFAKWLAPCISISPCGNILVQKRTAPLRRLEMKKYGRLPKFLTDVKMSNFGILGGKLVCHDYGYVSTVLDSGMRKVDWGVNT